MKHYRLLWIAGVLLLFTTACNNSSSNNEDHTDTLTMLPADTASAAVPPSAGDTAIPRVDPALDSAARQKDDALPPK